IAPHFHLPVQSGSDRILKKMRRDYTAVEYLGRLEALRKARPGIAITTDIIVGFPGETEEDFDRTFALTDAVRFDSQFSFIFSPRPRTAAGSHEEEWGAIPREVKIQRLERLQRLQRGITGQIMSAQVGSVVEVLVEGRSRFNPDRWFGRTAENRAVDFDGSAAAGAIARVAILKGSPHGLSGTEAQRRPSGGEVEAA
ncbi:MAG TPA: radical SAM protein, partial [Myxococcales bacterium]